MRVGVPSTRTGVEMLTRMLMMMPSPERGGGRGSERGQSGRGGDGGGMVSRDVNKTRPRGGEESTPLASHPLRSLPPHIDGLQYSGQQQRHLSRHAVRQYDGQLAQYTQYAHARLGRPALECLRTQSQGTRGVRAQQGKGATRGAGERANKEEYTSGL